MILKPRLWSFSPKLFYWLNDSRGKINKLKTKVNIQIYRNYLLPPQISNKFQILTFERSLIAHHLCSIYIKKQFVQHLRAYARSKHLALKVKNLELTYSVLCGSTFKMFFFSTINKRWEKFTLLLIEPQTTCKNISQLINYILFNFYLQYKCTRL